MTENARAELIAQLKTEAHRNPDLTNLDDSQIIKLIESLLEEKIAWARSNSPEAYLELSAMNFRVKRGVIDAVFESIRGLGVLGQIIADPDITEVMINGYKAYKAERPV